MMAAHTDTQGHTLRAEKYLHCALLLLMLCVQACRQGHAAELAAPAPAVDATAFAVRLQAWWDLPKDDLRSHDLSGIAWDAAKGTLYAIPDKTPQLVELVPDATFSSWQFGEVLPVRIPGNWDAEGLVVTKEGFVLGNEAGPQVHEINRSGDWQAAVSLPSHFMQSRRNLALESMTATEDGRYLFTANEQALKEDGPTATRQEGTLVRILRHDRATGVQAEFAYRTDPVFLGRGEGDLGVVDMAALSERCLLVMERSYVAGAGNSVRIYRVCMDDAPDMMTVEHLDRSMPVLEKTLYVDLGALPDDGFPAQLQAQPSRLMANFEGLALGPRLDAGRRLLFVISDDNSNPKQEARILTLVARDL